MQAAVGSDIDMAVLAVVIMDIRVGIKIYDITGMVPIQV
jgi:hypothetical protein